MFRGTFPIKETNMIDLSGHNLPDALAALKTFLLGAGGFGPGAGGFGPGGAGGFGPGGAGGFGPGGVLTNGVAHILNWEIADIYFNIFFFYKKKLNLYLFGYILFKLVRRIFKIIS
jgi:hypothetical protein